MPLPDIHTRDKLDKWQRLIDIHARDNPDSVIHTRGNPDSLYNSYIL